MADRLNCPCRETLVFRQAGSGRRNRAYGDSKNVRKTLSAYTIIRKPRIGGFPLMLVGYMRVSSESDRQVTDLQRDALLAAGVDGRSASDSELHGLYQHTDDSEDPGAAALARTADTTRLRRANPANLGAREPVWAVRP